MMEKKREYLLKIYDTPIARFDFGENRFGETVRGGFEVDQSKHTYSL